VRFYSRRQVENDRKRKEKNILSKKNKKCILKIPVYPVFSLESQPPNIL